jgi:riboflavin kinase / FMN adenylyltransferase
MRVIDHLDEYWAEKESVITIGAFDAVHLGHQALIAHVIRRARQAQRESGLVTFFPRPAQVLFPDRVAQHISTPGERAALLEQMGLDFMALIQFTRELANQPAEEFIRLIVDHLRPAEIWVGVDFSFGRNREGNIDSMRTFGREMGFEVHVLSPVQWKGATISSSRVRELLAEGQVDEAAQLLGRYYSLAGEVVPGYHRGRSLGFPTANLEVRQERAMPRDGVYACFVRLGAERFPAVASLGVRPTFDNGARVLEVYLMDVEINLYGCDLVVEFVEWIRPELKFGSADELVAQMHDDVSTARRMLHEAHRAEQGRSAFPVSTRADG